MAIATSMKLVAGFLAASVIAPVCFGRATDQEPPAPPAYASSVANPAAVAHSRYEPGRFAGRARIYYGDVWGIDGLAVKSVESGEMIRFSYRVLDPERAAVLNDDSVSPLLLDLRRGVQLVVPQMEQVGKLRQTNTPEAGKVYWMAFSNKGTPVKRGDRVSIVIGKFRADGLVVD